MSDLRAFKWIASLTTCLLVSLFLSSSGCGGASSVKSGVTVVYYDKQHYSASKATELAKLLDELVPDRNVRTQYSFNLTRSGRAHHIGYPVGKDFAIGDDLRRSYRALGRLISEQIFHDDPVTLSISRFDGNQYREIEKVVAVSADPAPLVLSFRKAITGDEYVLLVKNTGSNKLYMTCSVQRDGEAVGKFDIDLPSGSTTEHGWLQGFSFKAGDSISLANLEYEYGPARAVCPPTSP